MGVAGAARVFGLLLWFAGVAGQLGCAEDESDEEVFPVVDTPLPVGGAGAHCPEPLAITLEQWVRRSEIILVGTISAVEGLPGPVFRTSTGELIAAEECREIGYVQPGAQLVLKNAAVLRGSPDNPSIVALGSDLVDAYYGVSNQEFVVGQRIVFPGEILFDRFAINADVSLVQVLADGTLRAQSVTCGSELELPLSAVTLEDLAAEISRTPSIGWVPYGEPGIVYPLCIDW